MAEPFRILIANGSSNAQPDLQRLNQLITSQIPGCQTTNVGLEQLPSYIVNVKPPPYDMLIMWTRNLRPTELLLSDLNSLTNSGVMVVTHPQPLSIGNSKIIDAKSIDEILRAVDIQQHLGRKQRDINSGNQISMQATRLVVNVLRSQDQKFNNNISNLRFRYNQAPNIAIRDIDNIQSIKLTPLERHIFIASNQDSGKMIVDLSKLPNSVFKILFKTTVAPDYPTQFNLVTSDMQSIQSYINNILQSESSLLRNQQPNISSAMRINQMQYENTTRSVSAPSHNPLGDSLKKSQIRYINNQGQITNKNILTPEILANRGPLNLTDPIQGSFNRGYLSNGSKETSEYYQLHQTNSSGANGFAEASRPLSATSGRSTNSNYRIRMNSVKRVNNKGVLRSNLQPKVFILQSHSESYISFHNNCGLQTSPIMLRYLQQGLNLPQKSILLAPYERRREVLVYLNTRNPPISCVLFGMDLLPDNIVNKPQIELVTCDIIHVQEYLLSKGVRISKSQQPYMGTSQLSPGNRNNIPSIVPSGIHQRGNKQAKSVRFIDNTPQSISEFDPPVSAIQPIINSPTFEPSNMPNVSNIAFSTTSRQKYNTSGALVFQREWIVKKKPNSGIFTLFPAGQDQQFYFKNAALSIRSTGKLDTVISQRQVNQSRSILRSGQRVQTVTQQQSNVNGSTAEARTSIRVSNDEQEALQTKIQASLHKSEYQDSRVSSTPYLNITSNLNGINTGLQANSNQNQMQQSPRISQRTLSRRVINLSQLHSSSSDVLNSNKALTQPKQTKITQQRYSLTKANMSPLLKNINQSNSANGASSPVNGMSTIQGNISALSDNSNYVSANNTSSESGVNASNQTTIKFKKKGKINRKSSESESEMSELSDNSSQNRTFTSSEMRPTTFKNKYQMSLQKNETEYYNIGSSKPVYEMITGQNGGFQNPKLNQHNQSQQPNTRVNSPRISNGNYPAPNYIISEEMNENQSLMVIEDNPKKQSYSSLYHQKDASMEGSFDGITPISKLLYKNLKPNGANMLNQHSYNELDVNVYQVKNSQNIKENRSHLLDTPNFQRILPVQESSEKLILPTIAGEHRDGDLFRNSQGLAEQSKSVESAIRFQTGNNFQNKISSPLAINFTNRGSDLRLPALYFLSKGLEYLRPKIESLVSSQDRIVVYSRPQDIKKIQFSDYSIVFVLPKENEKLPDISQPNFYIIHIVKLSRQRLSHELFVKDITQLGPLVGSLAFNDQNSSRRQLTSQVLSQQSYNWNRVEQSIRSYSIKPKLLFPGSEVQLEQLIYKRLVDDVIPVKYFDSNTLLDRVKHFRKDKLIVVLVGSMVRNISQIKKHAKFVKFVVLEKIAKSAASRDEDVKLVTNHRQLLQTIEKMV